MAYPALTSAVTALWVAQDAGLFRKYGLDVTIKRVAGNAQPSVMQNGQIDFGLNAAVSTASAIVAGANIKTIALLLPYLGWWFYTAPGIKTPAQLQGKLVAQLPTFEPARFADLVALRKLGIPVSKVRFQTFGRDSAMIAAARAGEVQAVPVPSPQEVILKQLGWKLQDDELTDHIPFPTLSAMAPTSLLRKEPGVALAFVKALSAAIPYMREHPKFTAKTYEKWTKTSNAALAAQVAADQPLEVPLIPRWSMALAKVTMKQVATKVHKAVSVAPQSIYDNSIIDKLVQQGFYKKIDAGATAG